jgi:hypothetical protein
VERLKMAGHTSAEIRQVEEQIRIIQKQREQSIGSRLGIRAHTTAASRLWSQHIVPGRKSKRFRAQLARHWYEQYPTQATPKKTSNNDDSTTFLLPTDSVTEAPVDIELMTEKISSVSCCWDWEREIEWEKNTQKEKILMTGTMLIHVWSIEMFMWVKAKTVQVMPW